MFYTCQGVTLNTLFANVATGVAQCIGTYILKVAQTVYDLYAHVACNIEYAWRYLVVPVDYIYDIGTGVFEEAAQFGLFVLAEGTTSCP